MKTIKKLPGQIPELIDVANDEEAIRQELGGNIEAVTIAQGLAVLCGEEGRMKGLDHNFSLRGLGVDFVGPVLVVGVDGAEFRDVPHLDTVLWSLFRMVRYGRADRANNVWNCRRCGHLERFEANGPFENGWNVCPSCGGVIVRPMCHGTGH